MNKAVFFSQNITQAVPVDNVTFAVQRWLLDPANSFVDTFAENLENISIEIVGVETKLSNASGIATFNLADGTYTYQVYKMDSAYTTEVGELIVSGTTSKTVKLYSCLYTPNEIDNMIDPPTWVAGTYAEGFMVVDGGVVYVANTETSAEPPHADWTVSDRFIPFSKLSDVEAILDELNVSMAMNTIWGSIYINNLSGNYIQVSNIDLSEGTKIFGDSNDTYLSGKLHGNDLYLMNFTQNSNGLSMGLFESVNDVYNIRFVNANVTNGVGGGTLSRYLSGQLHNSYFHGQIFTDVTTGIRGIGGIIGIAHDGSLLNNCISDVDVVVEASENIGGLCGQLGSTTGASIENCACRGNITCTTSGNAVVGGLVGYAYISTIIKSYYNGQINTTTGTVSFTGGIVGRTSNVLISECHVEGDITATNRAAGIASYPRFNEINNCYVEATIEGSDVAGIANRNGGAGCIINNCYVAASLTGALKGGLVRETSSWTINNSHWDLNLAGFSTGLGLPRTTLQLKEGTEDSFILPTGGIDGSSDPANAMYTSWDNLIWDFGTIADYPILEWENI